MALLLLVAGCAGGSTSSGPSPRGSGGPADSSSSTRAATRDFVVGGDRPVTVHVPTSYRAGTPAPLLIALHGYGSSGREMERYLSLGDAAQRRGVITAFPNGTTDSSGKNFWNATDACCNFEASSVDDSTYLLGLVSAIKAGADVDPTRVYVMGHSNGGFMSYRMACDHADVVAAIVSVASATFSQDADCRPTTGVSVLEVHGTADEVIAYGGGTIPGAGSYPAARETAGRWATYDGCHATSSTSPKTVDVDAALPATGDPAESTVEVWAGCRQGVGVELWTITGGRHVPDISKAFPAAALDFLLAHPKAGRAAG